MTNYFKQKQENNESLSVSLLDGLIHYNQHLPKNPCLEDDLALMLEKRELFPDVSGSVTDENMQEIVDDIDNHLISPDDITIPESFKIKYRQQLNLPQLTACATTDRPLLVIAGAGSGKTRVITFKVAFLIEQGINPQNIVLLTFTKKAADEMLARVQSLLADTSAGNVLGGTFHGFANHALRRFGSLIGVSSNFSIADKKDSEDILDLLKTELDIHGGKKKSAFPGKEKIHDIISKARNLEKPLDIVIQKYFIEAIPHIESIKILSTAYQQFKKRSNTLDFDDLMIELRDHLRDNTIFRQHLQHEIKHVLIDEYQDTNIPQREIVELLAGHNGCVTVVGDDSQSIYSFRGANFQNILRFSKSFPGCGVVKIMENFRSTQSVLDFANDLIAHAKIGFRKRLFTHLNSGNKPVLKRFADQFDEAEYIANKILEIRDNDLGYNNFAVLTRASWHSNHIQAELTRRNIPFVVVGGVKFAERRHIKDILAFVRIILNPLNAIAWHRILKLLEGVGKVRAKEILSSILKNGGRINFTEFSDRKYYSQLKELETLLNKCIDNKMSVIQLVEEIFEFYTPILKQVEDNFLTRLKDLETLAAISGKYDDPARFVTEFTLDPPSNRFQDETNPLQDTDDKPLIVSTIHSAKGLEWHTVFVPHALDGLIPAVKNIQNLEEVEEERRVFYVAVSRAKKNLFITMPAVINSYDGIFTHPSRFLYDVDKQHYVIE